MNNSLHLLARSLYYSIALGIPVSIALTITIQLLQWVGR